jgi:hypothetical protein
MLANLHQKWFYVQESQFELIDLLTASIVEAKSANAVEN